MYMVRYDGAKEKWATKLTSSSASLPPYSLSKTGKDVYMIWWYAHHGRIAFDGTNWAAYFGAAISTSEGGCINIHQGDRMKVVNPSGTITATRTRSTGVVRTPLTSASRDIVPDSNPSSQQVLGHLRPARTSHWEARMPTSVHHIWRPLSMAACWLFGRGSSSGGDLVEGGRRTMYAQVLDASTGKAISSKVTVDNSVVGNRYQALKTYPDGSVAYLSKGKTATSLQVVRFFGC
ncbi:unnamed protein product [Peronospora belbahrii]|uniref:Fucose-specific lectin n=1 Tax=Peronospora belbahrii TaxID=622444 RepID=A0ABN8D6N4_9STRA|nr:unnamed protein product [Peronospora belbahrii]